MTFSDDLDQMSDQLIGYLFINFIIEVEQGFILVAND